LNYDGEEKRSTGDISERINELDKSIHKLKGWMASLSNDVNTGQIKVIEWQKNHEELQAESHKQVIAKMEEIAEPVTEIKNAISGLGVVSKGLIIIAKTVAAISVIYGAMWAFVHFGDPRSKP